MKRENCECGASIQLCGDAQGRYDNNVLDLFNSTHKGDGHQRVTAYEANAVRNFYGPRAARKAAAKAKKK